MLQAIFPQDLPYSIVIAVESFFKHLSPPEDEFPDLRSNPVLFLVCRLLSVALSESPDGFLNVVIRYFSLSLVLCFNISRPLSVLFSGIVGGRQIRSLFSDRWSLLYQIFIWFNHNRHLSLAVN